MSHIRDVITLECQTSAEKGDTKLIGTTSIGRDNERNTFSPPGQKHLYNTI